MFSKADKTYFPFYGYIGLLILVVGEILMFQKVKPISIYFTPIAWTGYILFADALNFKLKGDSLIKTRTREFLVMLPWSVFCWLIFEAYNLYLQNWYYIGLPENIYWQWLGYIWSFATIFPGILETTELVEPLFEKLKMVPTVHMKKQDLSKTALYVQIVIGIIFLTAPVLMEQRIARYLFGLVWLGFIFLLEPINYLLGGRSLFKEFEKGRMSKLIALLFAGLICGILWEFWNYWASAKWIYDVPLPFAGPKIFEMPLLGFLGFLPFAVECYSMQNFLMIFVNKNLISKAEREVHH